jgi:hypothetical protein
MNNYEHYRTLFVRIRSRLPITMAHEAAAFIFAELVNDALTRVRCTDPERLALVSVMNRAYQDTL